MVTPNEDDVRLAIPDGTRWRRFAPVDTVQRIRCGFPRTLAAGFRRSPGRPVHPVWVGGAGVVHRVRVVAFDPIPPRIDLQVLADIVRLRGIDELEVQRHPVHRRSIEDDPTMIHDQATVAECLGERGTVGDQNDGASSGHVPLRMLDALSLKPQVPDREHLVHEKDVRIEVHGDREAEPGPHPAAVDLHR